MTQTLSIQLLGGMSLCHGDLTLTEQLTGRQQELLAYLVLNRQMPHPRQRLAFQFWPDSPSDRARANLRKELSRLRRALPSADEYLWVTPKTLQWNPDSDLKLDVARFEDILSRAKDSTIDELKTAIALYRGEFLPDIDSEWVQPERDRLHQLNMRALETLCHQLEQQGEYANTVTYAQELLRIDELHEGAYNTLIRLYGLMGDRASALQTYHQCMTILREELGIDPSATTRQLYEQLLQEEAVIASPALPPAISLRPSLPLIGREREWGAIHEWGKPLQSGMGCSNVLFLVGEPGIGKTRLLEELCAHTQAEQIQVLWGSGYMAEMMRPYGFWIDILRSGNIGALPQLPAVLKALLPELGPPTQTLSDLSHLFDAVVELLMQLTRQAPLLIVLDDLQGIDEASAAVLNYVIRVMHHVPIGFACSARLQELDANPAASQVIKVLRRDRKLQTLPVLSLNTQATQTLAHSVDAKLDTGQIYRDSGGNPLFVLEIARAMADDQRAYSDNLESLIQDRLQQLDDATQNLVNWATVMGRNFSPIQVSKIANLPFTHFLSVMEKLEQQGILIPDMMTNGDVGYIFAHDVVRQVAYHQLSAPRRQLMHQHIAHQLQAIDPSNDALSSDIAYHAMLGQEPELSATAFLSAAERGLRLFAYADASSLAQQGIEQCQTSAPSSRINLHIRLLNVYVLAGMCPDQAQQVAVDLERLIREATGLGLEEEEAIGRQALIALHYEQENFKQVYENCLLAVEQGQQSSPVVNAKMLAYTGWCLADIGREMERAEALLIEAQTLTQRLGLETFEVPCGLGCIARYRGDYQEARPLLHRAAQMARAVEDHWRTFLCLSYLVMLELEAGDARAALARSQELKSVADQLDEGSEQTTALAYEALSHYWLQPSSAAVASALNELRHIDAQRTLAYVLTSAAEKDLEQGRTEIAIARCRAAVEAAQAVDQAKDAALAKAILIRGYLILGETELAQTELQTLLQTKPVSCSTRTQSAIASATLDAPSSNAPSHLMSQNLSLLHG